MRIPSGDLAPARRGRRRRRPLRVLLVVAAVAAAAGGAWVLRDDAPTAQRLAGRPTACPTPAPAAPAASAAGPSLRLPAAGTVSFRLLNGTPRDGLGREVGSALAARGFRVRSTGNAPRPLTGASRVYYGPGARPAAQLVAIHVIGAQLAPVGTAPRGAVDVVLGTGFARLRTPAEVASFTRRVLAGTTPVPAAVPRPSASATGCG